MIENDKNLEPRKVQKLGASSLIVTLPKRWATTLGIKPGDTVYLKYSDTHIKIIPQSILDNNKTIEINIGKDIPENLSRVAVSCLYILGVEDAIINVPGEEKSKILLDIKSASQDLVGVDIIEDNGSLRFRVFIDPKKLDFNSIIKNFDNIISMLIENILEIIETGIADERKNEIVKRDIIRYQHLLLRLLKEQARDDPHFANGSESCSIGLGTYLGLAADSLLNLARTLTELVKRGEKPEYNDESVALLKEVKKLISEMLSIFRTRDADTLMRLREKTNMLQVKLVEHMARASSKTDVLVSSMLLPVIRIIKIYTGILYCYILERDVLKRGGIWPYF